MSDSRIKTGSMLLCLLMCITLVGGAQGAKRFSERSGSARSVPVKIEDRRIPEADAERQLSPEMPVDAVEEDRMINWQVISSGGVVYGSSASYFHSGTINQSVIGFGQAGTLTVQHGFWQEPPMGDFCCDNPGDANSDGQANVGDAVFLITYIFKHGVAPECEIAADCNGDCEINVADVVYMVQFCFMDGHTPICGCSS